MPPKRMNKDLKGQIKASCFIKYEKRTPTAKEVSMAIMKSQLDVCGAAQPNGRSREPLNTSTHILASTHIYAYIDNCVQAYAAIHLHTYVQCERSRVRHPELPSDHSK